jgi:hypothetical protein
MKQANTGFKPGTPCNLKSFTKFQQHNLPGHGTMPMIHHIGKPFIVRRLTHVQGQCRLAPWEFIIIYINRLA